MSGPQRSEAAEWSISPIYSTSTDFDSNRLLVPDPRGTGSATVTADLRFARAMETSLLTIEPSYTLRRYTDEALGNGDDRSIAAAWTHTGEMSSWQTGASYSDQSTLTTELLETGIVSGNTHRRQPQASINYDWTQAELRHLVAQLSYSETSYYGSTHDLLVLPGFRYFSGMVGERFLLSEKSSLTVSFFGDELSSSGGGLTSHEYGLQAQLVYAFSERTRFDGSVGESSRLLNGEQSLGTNASLALTHDMTRGNLSLSYIRSLTPYGIGYLVERQQTSLQDIYHVTQYLDANVAVIRVDNNKNAVLLGLDRRNVTSLSTGLTWRPTQTFSVSLQVSMIQAPATQPRSTSFVDTGTLHDWRTAIRASWAPLPMSMSR
jgi:hypothetical protein